MTQLVDPLDRDIEMCVIDSSLSATIRNRQIRRDIIYPPNDKLVDKVGLVGKALDEEGILALVLNANVFSVRRRLRMRIVGTSSTGTSNPITLW